MEVGPGCTCIVIIVERLVSEPAGRAALCRRRAPRLRIGGLGCACVIVVKPLVSKLAGWAALRHRHRRAPRLKTGGPGCACVIIVEPLISEPAGRAALRRHHRRAPRLIAGEPGCAYVVIVEPLVSEPVGRAAPASSSSAPPARSPATAPMPIATLPSAASPSPTLAAATTDLLPPVPLARASPLAPRLPIPLRCHPHGLAGVYDGEAPWLLIPLMTVARPRGCHVPWWGRQGMDGTRLLLVEEQQEMERGPLASYSGKDQRVRGGGLTGVHGGEAKK
uniref:Uncharacterized protein n=1 Tax=Oryza meridionalis TaxID=40149 RepID=A0A0E0F5Z1_9ORYZ